MKIENSGLIPLSSKKTDGTGGVEKKSASREAASSSAISGRDRAEVSEKSRLLAKARAEMDSIDQVENERIDMLRKEIENGTYTVPLEELARRLVARLYPKD